MSDIKIAFDVYADTDPGCVRENNEDACFVSDNHPLIAVADGVGGAAAGEVASDLFVTACEQVFNLPESHSLSVSERLIRCFHEANAQITDYIAINNKAQGMACVAEILTFDDKRYYIGHVGDSRSYLIRKGKITQLTKDHTYIQEQIDLGLFSEEERRTHWMKNVVFRAVNGAADMDVDIYSGIVKKNDVFLLCSDGLTDMVEDGDILSIVNRDESVEEKVSLLIEAAKNGGGKDNVTVALCQINHAHSSVFDIFS